MRGLSVISWRIRIVCDCLNAKKRIYSIICCTEYVLCKLEKYLGSIKTVNVVPDSVYLMYESGIIMSLSRVGDFSCWQRAKPGGLGMTNIVNLHKKLPSL